MQSFADEVTVAAESSGFSGAVRVDRAGVTEVCAAFGYADRAHQVLNTVDTVFATASATKSLTALTVMVLVEEGVLDLDAPARRWLGDDLPLIADDVTVELLLAHRSGIGDYLDEDDTEAITDYVMPVPVHQLATTEDYLAGARGHPTVAPAGEQFRYNNGGYVVLALVAERAAGCAFADLVRTRVCEPAGMVDTAFLRSDELPGRAARGYLAVDGLRTNVLHLPVLGSGDGGTLLHRRRPARAVGSALRRSDRADRARRRDPRPRSDWPAESRRYGLGFHLHATSDATWLEGYDAGVSCLSLHQPSTATTYTVISNWSDGAWPIVRLIDERLGT